MPKQTLAPTPLVGWVYDLVLAILSPLIDMFFREVSVRGAWKLPKDGPVILVAAPHANQFVDSLILMRVMRVLNRRVSWLMAEKSFHVFFIGRAATIMGALPVARAQDDMKAGKGTVYLPDPENEPLLLRGRGTDFESALFMVGGSIHLPTVNGRAEKLDIKEIKGPEEIILRKAVSSKVGIKQLTGKGTPNGTPEVGFAGSKFKVTPHVDQTEVFNSVFGRLDTGGCIGIFPEGGSHDRAELLPLKAGVSIMALGALAQGTPVKLVPIGMNYFHPHKFRSRAVVQFGNVIDVPTELVQQYKDGNKREPVGQLLDSIYRSLIAVTTTCPDWDTMMVIHAARRLYFSKNPKLTIGMTVEVNRRLLKGYTKYKDDDRTKSLVSDITKYDQQLRLLNIRDHQVERAKLSVLTVLSMLVYRISLLTVMAIGTLPGLILFAPVFIATKRISNRKSKEALAGSSVKLSGRDVLATWKLIVGLAFAPFLYTVYTLLLAYWTYRNRIQGYLPNFVPIWSIIAFGYILFPSITFAALRIGEIGMDIVKSIRPLILCLNPTSAGSLGKLRETREELAARVEELINTLGPTMFPDFDYGEKFMEGIGEEGLDMEAVKQEGRSQRAFALGAWSHVTNEEAERLEDMGGLRKRVLGAE